MLTSITYTFPNNTLGNQGFFRQLTALLAELPNAERRSGSLTITPSSPAGALPVTVFTQSDIPFLQLHLGTSQELALGVGNLQINPSSILDYKLDDTGFEQVISKQDALGTYVELHTSSATIYRLPMDELVKRLKGHIVRIDHTGINIPSTLISKDEWRRFTDRVAKQANLYKYPTTDTWPFILPATKEEYETDITQFPSGREPKFEMVYDEYSPVPAIQIDIETDLTRPQVENLFPEPYGVSFPELADFFRTVYVQHELPGLAVRFDIRFKSDKPGDWETGKWLVRDGGRIKPKDL